MAAYVYQPLDVTRDETRLVTLYPGSRDESIRISLSHVPFQIPFADSRSSFSWEELQATLPQGWSVGETLEGKAIFHCKGAGDPGEHTISAERTPFPYTSWSHPDPEYNRKYHEHLASHTTHRSKPSYEALSYTWGSAQDTVHIDVISVITEVQHISTIQIGVNLYYALLDLRRLDKPRTLWIDALCINQDDLVERSKQVKRMEHIYTYARRVVVWLGTEGEGSSLALRTLEYLGEQLEYTKSYYWMPAPERKEKDWWLPEHRLTFDDEQWIAIALLIQRPWFGRLWVMQEIQLANDEAVLQCGETEVRWYYLRRAFLKFRRITMNVPQLAPDTTAYDMMHHLVYLSLNQTANCLEDVITTPLRCACTDPRDRIYGLMGLLPRPMANLVEPDYTLSVRDIYTQTLLHTITATRRWIPICIESLGKEDSEHDMPSWVPNYSEPETYSQIEAPISFASVASAAHVTYTAPDELHVTGVSCSHIAAMTDPLPGEPTAAISIARDFFADMLDSEDSLDYCAWTLSMSKLRDRWVTSDFDPTLADAKTILEEIYQGKGSRLGDCDCCYRPWVVQTFQRLKGRRLFKTKNGQMGISTRHARVGDLVIVALGLYFPMLLRSACQEKFRIVGRCYVQGLMDGEALVGTVPEPWKVVVRRSSDLTGVSVLQMRFVHKQTEEDTGNDPRLQSLPPFWEEVDQEDEVRLGVPVQHHRNIVGGEIINSDPRLLPDALFARGVPLQRFCLV